jgi:hypothetical protein
MKNNIYKYFEGFTFTLLCLIMIFSRSLTGLYIFNFRFGELLVGIGLFSASILVLNYLINKEYNYRVLNKYFLICVSLFTTSLFINNGKLLNLYTFKSSSYIWTASFLFLGLFFSDIIYKKHYRNILIFTPIIVYIFGTIHYPSIFENFFINNSDKFEYQKASDILIVTLVSLFIAKFTVLNNKNFLFYLFSISGLFFPLFLFMSKGSLLAFTFYFLFEILLNFRYLRKNIKQLVIAIIFGSIFFSFSTLNIWGDFNFSKPQSLFGLIENSSELTIADKFADIYRNKALDFDHPDKLIYLIDGRIYSNDVTSNWRLQIWQDVINDLFIENKIFFGYGYNDIIPAMDEVERRGTDGTNENVHNYVINILARGGLAQLAFFIYAYIQTVNKFFIKKEKLYAIQFLLTVMIVSFFDSSMESVRFPIIFYSVSGFFIQNSLKSIK